MTDVLESEPAGSRRSIVLRLFVWLANLYLMAFAGDALLSLADDALRVLGGEQAALHAIRNVVGLAVFLATALIPFLLLFVPHLPRPPFLLPIAFALFFVFGLPFLPVAVEWLSVVQVLVAAASFFLVKAGTGAWLLSAARLPRKRYLVARTLFATVVTVVVVPLLGLVIVVLGFLSALERETGGYLDLTASGIDVRESVLTKDGRTVVLVAMAHYGEGDFYRTLFDGLPAGSLVLAEGITDREKRSPAFPSMMKMAKVLGLTQQPTPGAIRSRVDVAPSADAGRPAGAPPEVVVADIDVADLSAVTLAVLGDLADLYGGDSKADALRRLVARSRTGDLATFKREVVDERNAHVLTIFDNRAAAYSTIVIPWGALHMPGLEAGLRERGYRIDTQRNRSVLRFGTIVDSLTRQP